MLGLSWMWLTMGLVFGCGAWNLLGLWTRSWWQVVSGTLVVGGAVWANFWYIGFKSKGDPTTQLGCVGLSIRLGLTMGVMAILFALGLAALTGTPVNETDRMAAVRLGIGSGVATAIGIYFLAVTRMYRRSTS